MRKVRTFLFILYVAITCVFSLCVSAHAEIYLKYKNPFLPQIPGKLTMVPIPRNNSKRVEKPSRPEGARGSARAEKRPIKPPAFKDVHFPVLQVSGLIWNSNRPQAIINGQVVDQGDEIKSVKIISIGKMGVNVLFQGKEMTLNL